MKNVITNQEFKILDDLAVAAGDIESALDRLQNLKEVATAAEGVRHAQSRIAHAIAIVLDVGDWDQDKWAVIGEYIRTGGREQLETFVDRLGIVVGNQEANQLTQGGET